MVKEEYADNKYPHKELTERVIGAALEVHRELGCGLSEAVYQEALGIELESQDVPFSAQVGMKVFYKGRGLEKTFRADFVAGAAVVVEIKASAALTDIDKAQLLSYLRASGLRVGLLLNFGTPSLQIKRMIA
ncbi:MAG: GxxExxY protein [Planctomycetota bacterium]|jgi:GxxExxY protein